MNNQNKEFYTISYYRFGVMLIPERKETFWEKGEPGLRMTHLLVYFNGKHYYEFFTKKELYEKDGINKRLILPESTFSAPLEEYSDSITINKSASYFQYTVEKYLEYCEFDLIKEKLEKYFEEKHQEWLLEHKKHIEKMDKERNAENWIEKFFV